MITTCRQFIQRGTRFHVHVLPLLLLTVLPQSGFGSEGWLYFGEYPNVWSDSQQEWLHFDHPSQPVYRYSDGQFPSLFDVIPLDGIDPSSTQVMLMRTMGSPDYWMALRFRGDGGWGGAYDLLSSEPFMEGTSSFYVDDRKNTMQIALTLNDLGSDAQIFMAIHLVFNWVDGGWYTLTSHQTGEGEIPEPASGFLGNENGPYWFYPNIDELPAQMIPEAR